jgi:MFS family permease
VGPLLALLALQVFQENLRMVFFLAFIPSCVTLAILIWFVRERTVAARSSAQPLGGISLTKLSPVLLMFLLVSFLFSLGNSSDVFLLLQAKNLGLSTTMVVLAYILYNVSQSVGATPLGALADRLGAKNVYAGGLAVFALVYFLFGYVQQAQWMWILFPLYGLYISATDGVSKSFIAEYITKEESGTYFGAYYTLIALGGFAASMIGGLLWSHLGPAWTFYFGSAMAVVALIAFFVGWRIPERV